MLSVVIGEELDNEALAVSIKTGKKHMLQYYLHFSIAFIFFFVKASSLQVPFG